MKDALPVLGAVAGSFFFPAFPILAPTMGATLGSFAAGKNLRQSLSTGLSTATFAWAGQSLGKSVGDNLNKVITNKILHGSGLMGVGAALGGGIGAYVASRSMGRAPQNNRSEGNNRHVMEELTRINEDIQQIDNRSRAAVVHEATNQGLVERTPTGIASVVRDIMEERFGRSPRQRMLYARRMRERMLAPKRRGFSYG
jgi:hypothetical protein